VRVNDGLCDALTVPGVRYTYNPAPGFTGADEFVIRLSSIHPDTIAGYPDGLWHIVVNVH
jgi:hypothetical protein